MPLPSAPRTYGALLGAIAGALVPLGRELSELSVDSDARALVIEGELSIRGKRLLISTRGDIALDCPIAYCGFKGLNAYAGQRVAVRLVNARITELRAEGTTINAHRIRTDGNSARRTWSLLLVVVGIGLFPLAHRFRGRVIWAVKPT